MEKEKALAHAKERFSEHIAVYHDYGNIATLDWAKPGHIEYRIRYIFDKERNVLSISGDLGEAVAYPTCKVDLEHCAMAFQSVDYFAEKIRASSDMFVYDEREAEDELRKELLSSDLSEEERDDREDLVNRILENYTYDHGVGILDDETSNDLNRIDPDAFEWIGTVGRSYALLVYLWMYGLQMAWEQVSKKNNPEIHVILGMSTANISGETRDYLDRCVDGPEGPTTFRKEDDTGHYGWWVCCFEEPEDIPEDLRECIRFAMRNGADWIMFDADATIYRELSLFDSHGGEWLAGDAAPAKYISIWDEGITVESNCRINIRTREVYHIEKNSIDGLEHLEGEFVEFKGVRHQVADHKPADDEWNELLVMDAYWRE